MERADGFGYYWSVKGIPYTNEIGYFVVYAGTGTWNLRKWDTTTHTVVDVYTSPKARADSDWLHSQVAIHDGRASSCLFLSS